MTTLIDTLTSAVDTAKAVKVKAAERGHENINTTIICHRGETPVAVIEMDGMDRDAMLMTAELATVGYEADMLTMAFETFMATTPINPRTGKVWEPGDMQESARMYEGRENGWIRDALMVYVANRAGDQLARTMPYRLHDRRVEWIDSEAMGNDGDDGAQFGGYVPRMLAAIMNRPSFVAGVAKLGVEYTDLAQGMSIEAATAIQDCSTTKVLMDPPLVAQMRGMPEGTSVALYSKPGTERDAVIRRSMPAAKRMRPPA